MIGCSKNMCGCMLSIGRRLSRLVALSDVGFGPRGPHSGAVSVSAALNPFLYLV